MKKHTCLLLILVTACCAAVRAQDHRWSFNFLGGAAFPVGQFAQTDEQNPKSGPVHTGSLLELSGIYHLNHTWGITLLANQQHNNSEIDEIIVPGGLPIPEVTVPGPLNGNPYVSQTIGPQHWTMTRILAGGVYTLPLNQKKSLALLFRALAGVQKTHVPEYEYFLKTGYVTGFQSFPARNLAWAFSYQADAGLQWKVYRRWSVLAFAGYNGSRPTYNQDITGLLSVLALNGASAGQVYKKIHFPTGSILVRAGVGFEL